MASRATSRVERGKPGNGAEAGVLNRGQDLHQTDHDAHDEADGSSGRLSQKVVIITFRIKSTTAGVVISKSSLPKIR